MNVLYFLEPGCFAQCRFVLLAGLLSQQKIKKLCRTGSCAEMLRLKTKCIFFLYDKTDNSPLTTCLSVSVRFQAVSVKHSQFLWPFLFLQMEIACLHSFILFVDLICSQVDCAARQKGTLETLPRHNPP